MDLQEVLAKADAELNEAEAQLRAVEGRVTELRRARDGLLYAIQRWATTPAAARPAEDIGGTGGQSTPTASASQSDLCLGVLRDAGRPATTNEVRDKLLAAGHNFNYEQVRGALAYLLRVKKIKRVGPGLWEVPSELRVVSVKEIMAADPGRPA